MSELNFAYVLACGDPTIRVALTRHFDNRFGAKDYFWLPELGGAKNLASPADDSYRRRLLEKIAEAQRIHPFGSVVLVNHSGCGVYQLGGVTFSDPKEEEAFHGKELAAAEEVIKKEFPGMHVKRHYFLKKEQQLVW